MPQWGFLAVGPETRVATALHDGHVADYAECPEYVFADARTNPQAAGLQPRKNIEPRLASFKYLGGDRVQVTYEWIVNDTLDADYHCFVHGVHPGSDQPDGIVFQQDHAVPQPTSRWQAGRGSSTAPTNSPCRRRSTVTTWRSGYYKGQRVALKGCDAEDRVTLARLKLDRSAGKIYPSSPSRLPGI